MLPTKDRVDDIRELEELWASPTAPERPLAEESGRRLATLPRVPGWVLAAGWVGFFTMVLAFEPMPAENMQVPLWGDLLVGAQLVTLFLAAFVGVAFGRFGFGSAVVAGGLGMAIAVACTATGHHAGNWWLAELGVTAALTGLAAGGLAQRLRGK